MDADLIFTPYRSDVDDRLKDKCLQAAIDKLQNLYPGKIITTYGDCTLGIPTDSLYSENGYDTYQLGLVDNEIPAMRNTRDEEVLTFRID